MGYWTCCWVGGRGVGAGLIVPGHRATQGCWGGGGSGVGCRGFRGIVGGSGAWQWVQGWEQGVQYMMAVQARSWMRQGYTILR